MYLEPEALRCMLIRWWYGRIQVESEDILDHLEEVDGDRTIMVKL